MTNLPADPETAASNLRRTRADMLGTADEEHYWHCHEAAALIGRLLKYAQHLPTCPTIASTDGPNAPYPCTCGYSALTRREQS